MKASNFRIVMIALLIGCLLASVVTYWELNQIMLYVDELTALPLSELFISWICKVLAISMLSSSIFLVSAQLKRNKENRIKRTAGENAGYLFEALSIPVIILTAYGVLPSWLLIGFGIFIVCIGAFHFCRVKNKTGVSFLLWGSGLIVLEIALFLSFQSEMRWIDMP